MSEDMFYLRDSRSDVGTSASFWAIGGGYTTDIAESEKFTKDRAVAQYRSRETDIPVRCDLAYAHAYLAVDCQHITDECLERGGDEFVYWSTGVWDGNNIRFVMSEGGHSYDYSKAGIFAEKSNSDAVRSLPRSLVDLIARPVCPARNLSTNKVLLAAGIEHVTPRRVRSKTLRCGGCGIFQSPHDHYAGCSKCGWSYHG